MERIAMIGFGEAGAAFAAGWPADAWAFDRKTDGDATRAAKLADYAAAGVHGCDDAAAAVTGATAILSLVTADQAISAAKSAAGEIAPRALYLDGNSVAPQTKRAAARVIEAAGGRYVDVAIMAPVDPKRRAAPLLLSGAAAGDAADLLGRIGFADVSVAGAEIGDASAIKMIRSVMIKGIEALSAECALAAEAAGVRDAVVASLDASWPGADWRRRLDYNLDRMMVHGARRGAEMDEVVAMLDALGAGSAMSRGTVVRQRAIGALGLAPPPGLDAKVAAIRKRLSA